MFKLVLLIICSKTILKVTTQRFFDKNERKKTIIIKWKMKRTVNRKNKTDRNRLVCTIPIHNQKFQVLPGWKPCTSDKCERAGIGERQSFQIWATTNERR